MMYISFAFVALSFIHTFEENSPKVLCHGSHVSQQEERVMSWRWRIINLSYV